MSEFVKAVYGQVRNVKAYPSSGNCVVEIEIPVEFFQEAAQFMAKNVLVTAAKLGMRPYGVVEAGAHEPAANKGNSAASAPKEMIVIKDGGGLVPPVNNVRPTVGNHHFPGGLCGLSVRWCQDEHFQEWVADTYPDVLAESKAPADANPAVLCKYVILDVCKIESRKQLDSAPGADHIFRAKFLEPYAHQRVVDGLNDES